MKTHRESAETGDPGVDSQRFCSTAFFWKLETFITPLLGNKF